MRKIPGLILFLIILCSCRAARIEVTPESRHYFFLAVAVKDDPQGQFRAGNEVEIFAVHWAVDLVSAYQGREFFDKLFFLIWTEETGWKWIEQCYLRPIDKTGTPPCSKEIK